MKKRITALLLSMMMVILLAACSSGAKSENSDNTSKTESTKAVEDMTYDELVEAAKGTTVTFYGWGGDDNLNDWLDNYYAPRLKEKYDITSQITISKFLNNSFDENKIKYEYNGLDKISYKNKIGDKLGSVNIIYDDNKIGTFDVFLTETINFSLFRFLLQTKLIYLIGATIIILFIIICFLNKRKDIKKKS